jgi:hypothetical protein
LTASAASPCHSIPDKQLAENTDSTPTEIMVTDGEGVYNFWEQFELEDKEKTPLSESGSHTDVGDNYEI